MVSSNFAEAIKKARATAGLSQQGLADQLRIPKRTIQQWEIDARTPPAYVQRLVLNELELLNWLEEQERLSAREDGDFELGKMCGFGTVINYIKARKEGEKDDKLEGED